MAHKILKKVKTKVSSELEKVIPSRTTQIKPMRKGLLKKFIPSKTIKVPKLKKKIKPKGVFTKFV